MCAASGVLLLEAHGRAFALDARPDGALFLVAEEHPVGDFHRGAAAAFADVVEERRAHADARAVGKVVKIGCHEISWGGMTGAATCRSGPETPLC
ncbi:hypothetical protein PT2222_50402 [Paraburkholderia tropica]